MKHVDDMISLDVYWAEIVGYNGPTVVNNVNY